MIAPAPIVQRCRAREESLDIGPPVLILTRDDPGVVRGGVETFCAHLREVCPGSTVVPYQGAAGPRRWFNEARDARAIVHRVRSMLHGAPYEAIVANGAGAWALPNDLPVPVVTVFHGTYSGYGTVERRRAPLRGWWTKGVGAWLEGRAGRRARRAVAVSSNVAREVWGSYGVPTTVIENAVPTRKRVEVDRAREPDPVKARLLFVGRPTWSKGFDLIVRLARRRPSWSILVAGGEVRDAPSNVLELGRLNPDEVAALYPRVDLTLLPSRYEGCSYVPLEAMVSGCPVVTSAVGAFTDVGQRPFGATFPAGDYTAFERAVDGVLERSSTLDPIEYAERRFSFDRFAQEWASLLWEVTA